MKEQPQSAETLSLAECLKDFGISERAWYQGTVWYQMFRSYRRQMTHAKIDLESQRLRIPDDRDDVPCAWVGAQGWPWIAAYSKEETEALERMIQREGTPCVTVMNYAGKRTPDESRHPVIDRNSQ